MNDVKNKLTEMCLDARRASRALACSTGAQRNAAVAAFADALESNAGVILDANALDLAHARANGMRESMQDRLALTQARISGIAASLRKVVALGDPIGGGEVWTRPNGLSIRRVHVPLGVVAMIYEARPNVTADAAALCVKSGNAVILRGGSDAINTNRAIADILREALETVGLDKNCINLLDDTSREAASELMKMNGMIDLLIPRGSAGLIRSVTANATVPFVETGAGNCHVYVHSDADIDMALKIIVNAKTQRPSVCNAAETLLVHSDVAEKFLPLLVQAMPDVELRGCEKTRTVIDCATASESDWETEYDDLILAIRVVDTLEEATEHINRYNTHHSEAIVTSSLEAAQAFRLSVDAAVVYVNASTRFTDGEEFGFGAEIGISTQKLHARGPMGLEALTTIKYYVDGDGQIRT